MNKLVGQGGIIAAGAVEGVDWRHVDAIFAHVIEGFWIIGRVDPRAGRGKEGFKMRVGFGAQVAGRFRGFSGKLLRQAVDLVGVENAVSPREAAFFLLAGFLAVSQSFWFFDDL